MIELYCLKCARKIEYTGAGVVVCPVCGHKKHVVALDAESADMHSKAEFYLCDGQYFNALKMYEILLKRDESDATALFGAILAEYGAKYTDNYDGTYTFSCERTQAISVYESAYYKRLLETENKELLCDCKKVIDDISAEQEKNNKSYLDTAPVDEQRDYRAEAKATDENLADDYLSARDKYLEAERKEKEEAEARRFLAAERAVAAQKARERRAALEAEREKKKKLIIRISCAAMAVIILGVLAFTLLIPQIRYSLACSDMEAGKYDAAAKTFRALGGFRDSEIFADKYKLYGLDMSDTLYFGKYEQDANEGNGKEDIEWVVIGTDEYTVTLMSVKVLDCVPYDEKKTKPSYWNTCSLRTWLNEDFALSAFSERERSAISEKTNKNPNNDEYKTLGCEDTSDKVWALSLEEANALPPELLSGVPSAYAIARGVYQKDGFEGTYFWLRSPGSTQNQAAFVSYEGKITPRGSSVDYQSYGVRACITLTKGIIE